MVTASLQQHYDDYYDASPNEWRQVNAVAKADNIIRAMAQAKTEFGSNLRVLEIGCGDGSVMAELEQRTPWIIEGIDISRTGVERAVANGLAASKFDGARVPQPDQAFDLVIMTHVVEHLEDPRSLLTEARRIARLVFVEVPLLFNLRTPYDYTPNSVGHINLYNPLLIRQLLQTCGLKILSEFTTNPSIAAARMQRSGRKADVIWGVRELLHRALPRTATRIFCYHGSLLASAGDTADAAEHLFVATKSDC